MIEQETTEFIGRRIEKGEVVRIKKLQSTEVLNSCILTTVITRFLLLELRSNG
jgi:hypothetical protein